MQLRITREAGYLKVELQHRETAEHYSWEITSEPAVREVELLREYQAAYGRLPRMNAASAA